MKVQVRHFLKGSFANGVPYTHALAGEGGTNRPCNPREHGHDGSASGRIKFAYVVNVLPRNDKNVARMELPKIDERNGLLVFTNDASRFGASNYSAENASVSHEIPQQSNAARKPRADRVAVYESSVQSTRA
jgi:hypothetical protein